MPKALDQQLFDQLYRLIDFHFKIYASLPQTEVPYPFVSLGEMQIVAKQTSSKRLGKAFATIHVFGEQRIDVSSICQKIMEITRVIQLDTRYLKQVVNASSWRILEDDSTSATLWHGVILLEFNIL